MEINWQKNASGSGMGTGRFYFREIDDAGGLLDWLEFDASTNDITINPGRIKIDSFGDFYCRNWKCWNWDNISSSTLDVSGTINASTSVSSSQINGR
jgi:hypothetical protein